MNLLLCFIAYFGLAFVGRSWLAWHRTGHNPMVLPTRDDAHGYVGRCFKGVMLAVLVVCVLHAWAPATLAQWGGLRELQGPVVHIAGWVVLGLSSLWTLWAQATMGASWRIGIDEAQHTELVRDGLFRLSRNPIFLGMRLNLLGLFLVLPHAFTLAVLVAGELLMQLQVRLEEPHLLNLHGDDYRDYCARVRRWL